MQVFFILFSVHFAVYQYINSKCLYRTHVKICTFGFSDYSKLSNSYAPSSFFTSVSESLPVAATCPSITMAGSVITL